MSLGLINMFSFYFFYFYNKCSTKWTLHPVIFSIWIGFASKCMITIVKSMFEMLFNCLLQNKCMVLTQNFSFCDCHIFSCHYVNSALLIYWTKVNTLHLKCLPSVYKLMQNHECKWKCVLMFKYWVRHNSKSFTDAVMRKHMKSI